MDFRKNIIFYLVPVLFSIAITSLPLLTTRWIGLEKSLYAMYITEGILGAWVISYIYKCCLKLGSKMLLFKFLVLIIFIQIIFYVKREPNFGVFHISTDHIIPYLFAIFIIPFSEECIYRGCLIDFFSGIFKGNVIWPVMLSSAVFCGMHTQYSSALDFTVLFVVSLIFSFARLKSGSLLPSIILHSFMNCFVILLSNLNVF
ncbi:TPA: CPBP family intramembrane glutamic endopeptidase [Enterobacter ludwigii]|uniref:CPBP family intramembrane glutamic endopeptidase n=1 Tax=Enterobacter TaxID=547 RepID=UPI000DE41B8E|nr:CPBP family intramembrane glutamic endopeptidase [Enterobacter ludwigii]EKS7109478.1 CPBP family intramembrane metalloprotease [Enterobacter ludwigii]ELQ7821085.1 CPBP family intramembrane metalloprotease [Enterobacter ludwigii]MBG0584687.1 CPBP family intramembrane metalloprotease [Enterobacter ludwigii]MBG0700476.1 CPBP family intramembrane metalloprotease [Enterobacter ludwigii]MBK1518240.1 CPBP family intramembrane metalloprotease [Enterobacter ludwigii]